MYPQTHFLFGYVIALIFSKLDIIDYRLVLPIALLSLLIDVDHYISHVIHTKELSIRKAWNVAVRNRARYERTFLHHETGFIMMSLMIFILFFINDIYSYILGIAYYSHMILDYPTYHRDVVEVKVNHFIIDVPRLELFFDIFLIGLIGFLYLI